MTTPAVRPTPLNAGVKSVVEEVVLLDAPAPKKRRLQLPKLTAHEFTAPTAVASLIAVGRATSEEYEKNKGRRSQASFLAAVIRRASRWAAEVAPQHTLPQFVTEARTLATSRPVRALVADIRLAQLRGADVTNDASDNVLPGERDQNGDTNAGAASDDELMIEDEPVADTSKTNEGNRSTQTALDDGPDDDEDTVVRRGRPKKRPVARDRAGVGSLIASGPVMADVPDEIDEILGSSSAVHTTLAMNGTVGNDDTDGWEDPEDDLIAEMEDSERRNQELRELFPSRTTVQKNQPALNKIGAGSVPGVVGPQISGATSGEAVVPGGPDVASLNGDSEGALKASTESQRAMEVCPDEQAHEASEGARDGDAHHMVEPIAKNSAGENDVADARDRPIGDCSTSCVNEGSV